MDAQRAQRTREELRQRRSLLRLNPAVPLSGEGDAKPGEALSPGAAGFPAARLLVLHVCRSLRESCSSAIKNVFPPSPLFKLN